MTSDPIPEGYVTLCEAVARLSVDMADREVFSAENSRALRSASGLFYNKKDRLDTKSVGDAKSINANRKNYLAYARRQEALIKNEPRRREIGRAAPRDHVARDRPGRAAKSEHSATWRESAHAKNRFFYLAWAKRELAILKLYEAFREAALAAFIRDSKSEEMFRLTDRDWHGHAFWRQTIIGGVVQASVDQGMARHSGRDVLIEEAALVKWMKARPRAGQVAAENECLSWLKNEMLANPDRAPRRKKEYRAEAKERFGVPMLRFEVLWRDCERTHRRNMGAGPSPQIIAENERAKLIGTVF